MKIQAFSQRRIILRLLKMKGLILSLLAILLFGGSACSLVRVTVHVSSASNPGSSLTGVNCKLQRELTNQQQKTNVWCWAASAHTVIQYLKNEPIEQCRLVDAYYHARLQSKWGARPDPPDCCMPMPEDYTPKIGEDNILLAQQICYQNGYPEEIFSTRQFATRADRYDYDWTIPYPHGLGWDEIVEEICADRPMISALLYSQEMGNGVHFVVIGGYSELEDGSQFVHVYDPGFNTEEDDYYLQPYDVYLGNPGVFTHARDYKNISLL